MKFVIYYNIPLNILYIPSEQFYIIALALHNDCFMN
jgi:hypothetical protein